MCTLQVDNQTINTNRDVLRPCFVGVVNRHIECLFGHMHRVLNIDYLRN